MNKKDARIIIGCQQRAAAWSTKAVELRDLLPICEGDYRDEIAKLIRTASFMSAHNAEEARVRMGMA